LKTYSNVRHLLRETEVDLQGYEINIQNEVHRRNLIKDSRFYNLRHLTEMLIPAKIYHNPFRGNVAEILINITDFRPTLSSIGWVANQSYGWMEYKRPHDVDLVARDLAIQIEDDGIVVGGGRIMLINRQALNSVMKLKEAAEGRKTEAHPGVLIAGQQEVAVKIEIPHECHCIFDGVERSAYDVENQIFDTVNATPEIIGEEGSAMKKRKLSETAEVRATQSPESASPSNFPPRVWMLNRSVWRIKVRGQPPPVEGQPMNQITGGKRNMILVAVKLEGWSKEREFSKEIGWL